MLYIHVESYPFSMCLNIAWLYHMDGAIHGLGGGEMGPLIFFFKYNYKTIYLGTNFSNFVQ